MKLKANFTKDWLALLRVQLTGWGYDHTGLSDNDLPFMYFNAQQRRVSTKKRAVFISDTFSCPPNLQSGWQAFQQAVTIGDDVTPYLSKGIKHINATDGLLNDWGVHHFHLGNIKFGRFVDRTGPLLFAMVTDEALFAIGIYAHGQWTNLDIVENIHRNWPEIISKYRINDITGDMLSASERAVLRKKNANSFTRVADGTVYAPMGGGTASSGLNIHSIIDRDRQFKFLENLQRDVEAQAEKFLPALEQRGYQGETEVEVRLDITEEEYIIIFPLYNFGAILIKRSYQ